MWLTHIRPRRQRPPLRFELRGDAGERDEAAAGDREDAALVREVRGVGLQHRGGRQARSASR